ncbi:MAG: XTP/dITP diphosphatase [Deltaproteobacteria bacterium]|nr:XTP/dITP diphosphatase [Deltaproteobacteria bacterium]
MVLVVATRNRGKLREIAEMLGGFGIEIRSPDDFPGAPEPVEDADTYRGNALIKARALRDHSGFAALADDSGLEVDSLDGAPGVVSARFAGPEQDPAKNRTELLRATAGVPEGKRAARFVCVIALALPGGDEHVFEGECKGTITTEERGSSGFGYDPIFFFPELGKTFAELDPATKNRVSHRARALKKLKEAIRSGQLPLA